MTDSRAAPAGGRAPTPSVPVAATVLLLRDGARGPEVLHDRASRPRIVRRGVGVPRRQARADGRRGAPASPRRMPRAAPGCARPARRPASRSTPRTLTTLSCWDPPPGHRAAHPHLVLRCAAPPGDAACLAADEAVAASGCAPADMLERHGRGEVTLYPPTWVTLHELARAARRRALLGAARLAGVAAFRDGRAAGRRRPGAAVATRMPTYDARRGGRGIRRPSSPRDRRAALDLHADRADARPRGQASSRRRRCAPTAAVSMRKPSWPKSLVEHDRLDRRRGCGGCRARCGAVRRPGRAGRCRCRARASWR